MCAHLNTSVLFASNRIFWLSQAAIAVDDDVSEVAVNSNNDDRSGNTERTRKRRAKAAKPVIKSPVGNDEASNKLEKKPTRSRMRKNVAREPGWFSFSSQLVSN
jgi:hypothetical protein